MSDNPYRHLPDHHFWRRSVSGVERFRLDPVVETRFTIGRGERLATAGSCFAQHISHRIASIGFNYFLTEAGEHLGEKERRRDNYGVFSARYGNIYTSRQLWQLFQECFGERTPAESVWQRADGRFVDALRPRITPEGFASAADVRAARGEHLEATRRMFRECEVFVFTLGLTECWRSRQDGTVFPLAPGVAGGTFEPDRHEFINLSIDDVRADMEAFLEGLRGVNPGVRAVLTVSPVPLIATYEDQHVLVSTTYSKSLLRVAAGMMRDRFDWVEYFPSYELITGNFSDSAYFDRDYRQVNEFGVDHAMRCFVEHFTGHERDRGDAPRAVATAIPAEAADVICDEEVIEQIMS